MKKFSVSLSVIILLALLISYEHLYIIFSIITAVAFHELGHILAIKFCSGKIKKFKLCLSGMNITYSGVHISYRGEALIALAGPLVNLMIFAIFVPIAKIFETNFAIFFCAINFVLSLFNMLPALPLDGGIFLRAVLLMRFDIDTSLRIINIMTIIVGFVMIACGMVITIVTHGNITMMIAGGIILGNINKDYYNMKA